ILFIAYTCAAASAAARQTCPITTAAPLPVSWLATASAVLASHPSSAISRRSNWPLTPPARLMSATARAAPVRISCPRTAKLPVIGPATPTTTSARTALQPRASVKAATARKHGRFNGSPANGRREVASRPPATQRGTSRTSGGARDRGWKIAKLAARRWCEPPEKAQIHPAVTWLAATGRRENSVREIMRKFNMALVAATALIGAASAASAQSNAPAAAAGAQDVKLGILMGFTGPLEQMSPPMAKSAQLVAAQVNAQGGILKGGKLCFVQADDTCTDATSASNAADRLINTEKVVAIVGAMCSGVTIAVANTVAVPAGVVMISSSATAPTITGLNDKDLVFRTAPSDAYQGEVLARLLM